MVDNSFLHFVEYELQIIALSWMAILYAVKAFQLSRLPMVWEKAPKKGNSALGVMHTYTAIFMPWSMESSKKHFWRWLEFGIYHIGAGVAILNTFTLPFAPDMMTLPVRIIFAILIGLAIPVGLIKLARRIARPELRAVSTADDYFSLVTLTFFFLTGVIALLTNAPVWRLVYFLVTAFFLFYVPFSKISHYIYFLFAGVITGSRYGRRGILPQGESAS
jgi:nitrate reductase gamma subunit